MKDTMETSPKWAVELYGMVSDSKRQVYSVWVVLAPFCAMRFTNDLRYVEGDRKETRREEIEASRANVQYRASRAVSREEFREHELLQMAALTDFSAREELSVDYEGISMI